MTVFADRDRIGAQIAQFVIGFGVIGEYLFLNYYLQEVQHYSALAAGLAYLPFIAVQVLTTSLVLKRAAGRVGSRFLMPVGLVAGAAGTAALGFIRPDTPYTACVLPAMVLIGIGWGMFFSVASEVVVRGAEQSQVGIAAAVGSSLNSIGGSIGTALLGTIASAVSAGSAAPADLARGYLATFWVCAAVLVVGAALIAPILRPGPLHTDRK